MNEFSRSRHALSRASVVKPAMRSHETLPLAAPIFVRACRRWSLASSRSMLQATNESVRRKGKRNADKRCSRKPPHLAVRRAPCKARSPIGVPPRLLPKGVIVPKAHPGPGFVRRASRGGFAADASPHFQRAPRAPVIVPAGLIPETPGSGGDEPPPAGTAPRSDQPGSPADVLHGERDYVPLFKSLRQCQSESFPFAIVQTNRDVTRT